MHGRSFVRLEARLRRLRISPVFSFVTTLWAARLPSRVLCKASTFLPEEDTGALSTTACPKPVICNNDAHLRIFAFSFKDFFFPRACLCIMVVPKEIPVSTESFSAPYVLRFLISVSRFSSSFSLLRIFFNARVPRRRLAEEWWEHDIHIRKPRFQRGINSTSRRAFSIQWRKPFARIGWLCASVGCRVTGNRPCLRLKY